MITCAAKRRVCSQAIGEPERKHLSTPREDICQSSPRISRPTIGRSTCWEINSNFIEDVNPCGGRLIHTFVLYFFYPNLREVNMRNVSVATAEAAILLFLELSLALRRPHH